MESSLCHTERRKNKREGREVTIITLLADGGIEVGTNTKGANSFSIDGNHRDNFGESLETL